MNEIIGFPYAQPRILEVNPDTPSSFTPHIQFTYRLSVSTSRYKSGALLEIDHFPARGHHLLLPGMLQLPLAGLLTSTFASSPLLPTVLYSYQGEFFEMQIYDLISLDKALSYYPCLPQTPTGCGPQGSVLSGPPSLSSLIAHLPLPSVHPVSMVDKPFLLAVVIFSPFTYLPLRCFTSHLTHPFLKEASSDPPDLVRSTIRVSYCTVW